MPGCSSVSGVRGWPITMRSIPVMRSFAKVIFASGSREPPPDFRSGGSSPEAGFRNSWAAYSNSHEALMIGIRSSQSPDRSVPCGGL
jgi:hypothetical protein